jgi:hypothetical protein
MTLRYVTQITYTIFGGKYLPHYAAENIIEMKVCKSKTWLFVIFWTLAIVQYIYIASVVG